MYGYLRVSIYNHGCLKDFMGYDSGCLIGILIYHGLL